MLRLERDLEPIRQAREKEIADFWAMKAQHGALLGLMQLLSDPEAQIRARAAFTLGKMQRTAPLIVPALLPLLNDEDANVRREAASALGNLGLAAKAAVPALKEQANDQDSPIAALAAEMLKRIEP